MVNVVVLRPFRYRDVNVDVDQTIEMEPIDAAVKAREGLVSLMHGTTYQTREMVAGAPVQGMSTASFVAPEPAGDPLPETLPKRRRGRPRKSV